MNGFGYQRLNGIGDDYENAPVVAAPAKDTQYTVTRNDGTVLYSGDNAGSEPLTTVPKGEKVVATGKESTNAKLIAVKYDGKEGFLNKEHLSQVLKKTEFSWLSFGIGSAVGFVGALILRKLLK